MKRAGNLYHRIHDHENLCLAFSKACRGKQGRKDVILFRQDFERNIEALKKQLRERKVQVGNYHFFHVHDPKKRLICAASFPERVLHHAVMNVCEPVLESYAISDTYACRKGKGGKMAVERACQFSRRFGWYLKLDISRYFDSIDHRILMELVERRFKDKDLLSLLEEILGTYCTRPGKGLPIGNLISQHMANFYLGFMDHFIKEVARVRGYVRYMDDFIIWGGEKSELKRRLETVSCWLQENLALRLKDNIQLNRCARGIPFLGYRIFPSTVRMGTAGKRRFVERFKTYENRCEKGMWSEAALQRHMEPLVAFVKGAHARAFRTNVMHRYGVLS